MCVKGREIEIREDKKCSLSYFLSWKYSQQEKEKE